jgi:AcrR family transcriptional regulator
LADGSGTGAAHRTASASGGKARAKRPMPEAAQNAEKLTSRSQLLEAACSLMIERGSIEVSLSDIAQRSQLNSALVKYYFGSKNGMMMAVLEDVLGRALGQMTGLLSMNLNPVDKLKLHIKGIITIYFRYPFINRLIHAMFQEPELAKQVAETINRPLANTQRQLLEQGVKDGVFRPIDPMLFYFIVLGACDHLFFGQQILLHAFGIPRIDEDLRRSYTNTLLDLILGGILLKDPGKERTDTVSAKTPVWR